MAPRFDSTKRFDFIYPYPAGEVVEIPQADDLAMMPARERQVAGNHYATMKIQPLEFAHANGLGFAEGLALKYLVRHKQKNGKEDLLKAIHVLQLLIELEYPDKPQHNM